MRKKPKTLPKDLDDTYTSILLNVKEEFHEETISALTWLVFSEKPLCLKELAEAMAIDVSSDPAFDPDERLLDPKGALTVLSNLVSILPNRQITRKSFVP